MLSLCSEDTLYREQREKEHIYNPGSFDNSSGNNCQHIVQCTFTHVKDPFHFAIANTIVKKILAISLPDRRS